MKEIPKKFRQEQVIKRVEQIIAEERTRQTVTDGSIDDMCAYKKILRDPNSTTKEDVHKTVREVGYHIGLGHCMVCQDYAYGTLCPDYRSKYNSLKKKGLR